MASGLALAPRIRLCVAIVLALAFLGGAQVPLAVAQQSPTQQTTVNFEGLQAQKDALPANVAAYLRQFGITAANACAIELERGHAQSPKKAIAPCPLSNPRDDVYIASNYLMLSFSTPVQSVSLWVAPQVPLNQADTVSVYAYSSKRILPIQVVSAKYPRGTGLQGWKRVGVSTPSAQIVRIRIATTGKTNFFFAIDDLSFTKPAPENQAVNVPALVGMTPVAVVPSTKVPNLIGLTGANAQALLKKVGLTGSESQTPHKGTPGIVFTQTPPAGAVAHRGDTVTFEVALLVPVTVPNLIGRTDAKAKAQLAHAGLIGMVSELAHQGTPGTVFTQTPQAGAAAHIGDTVTYQVALPVPTTVPNLIGLTSASAQAQLKNARLNSSEIHVPHQGTPGTVFTQTPQAGAAAHVGDTVIYEVAQPVPTTVPSLIGLTSANARALLKKAGLTGSESQTPHPGTPGTVFTQTPQAGATAHVGDTVTYQVALPMPVTVPNLIGLTRANAEKQLTDAGLKGTESAKEHQGTPGTVFAQDPSAGATAHVGDTVTYQIALAIPITVPNLIGMTRADAEGSLARLGLGVISREIEHSGNSGRVFAQNPAAGATVERGNVVAIDIAKTPVPPVWVWWLAGTLGVGLVTVAGAQGAHTLNKRHQTHLRARLRSRVIARGDSPPSMHDEADPPAVSIGIELVASAGIDAPGTEITITQDEGDDGHA